MTSTDLELSLIVAMTPEDPYSSDHTRQRVIGLNGKMPWGPIPSDLDRFRSITTDVGTVIEGRTTFDSLPIKADGIRLPGRHHIVLTRKHDIPATEHVTPVGSFDDACETIRKRGGKACVIGGAQIYELFLPHVRDVYITYVETSVQGDTFFPAVSFFAGWQRISGDSVCQRKWHWNPKETLPTAHYHYRRIPA